MLPFVTILGRSLPMYGLLGLLGFLLGLLFVILRVPRFSLSRDDAAYIYVFAALGALAGAKLLYLLTVLPRARGARALRLGGGGAARLRLRRLRVPRRRARRARGGMGSPPGPTACGSRISCRCSCPRSRSWRRSGASAASAPAAATASSASRPSRWSFPRPPSPRPPGVPRLPCSSLRPPCSSRSSSRCCGSRQGRGRARFAAEFYLACYCPARFLLEFFRGDDARGALWGLSTSQWLSAAGSLAVSLYFFMRSGRKMPD